ncbi:MAG TPA: ATP-binding cassette domain-containing protein [Kofleriaceae bacterium]|nr:ATP-binding cassette domain-containing protein [Kofleriaceae bacterium]
MSEAERREAGPAGEILVEAELSKRYGAVLALHAARLAVRRGTVHALVGENGAGKSTLVKILAGVVPGDGGKLAIGGAPVDLAGWTRIRARAAGIGIVQQHGASAETLTVVENAVLGVEPRRHGLLALGETADALRALGAKIGLPVDPDVPVERLSLGAAQRAEIVAALHHGAKLLILDEPTAVLTPIEVDGLLERLRALAAGGTTIVIVTHKLDEVRAVADDVTVLRDGETVATFAAAGAAAGAGASAATDRPASGEAASSRTTREREALDVGAIAKAMVGAELPGATRLPAPPADARPALELVRFQTAGLQPIDLAVRAGEIVGVAGVDGNGQRELALAIAGLQRATGAIRIGGADLSAASPARRLAAGLAHIPEDRHHGGLLLDATVAENLALGRRDVTGRWRIDGAAVRRHAVARITELDIRPADSEAVVRSLSGGNQQKVVVARELSRPDLRAVIAAQPTRGVDLGAVARIHERLGAAAKQGAGVLVISADLDELLALCHRIVVLLRGAIVGAREGEALHGAGARSALGVLMTGAEARGAAGAEARP